ncbi:4-hydroxyphenylpyruvate dioxygenase family protein [Anaeromyxobacter diazotrophicus]|uniref:4-hydroxyphenylpyruvate dioxygenase n=1 Tax=Anaeromyxobacter diazotrophicus TaxID=2590199 RepID=A0A7I9VRN4_9BACT|nr:VOC family protein [Anaeromyxobacter diazotrophicus]GEJ59083.1 4-hydroxyphenylpyruvate dioxygenase [Anaeromyxobacter diazotrophicus]
MAPEPIGIVRLEGLHYYVHDLERSRRFYTEKLDFAETALSTPELEREGRQRSAVFEAGAVRVLCSQPVGEGGRAWRWLRKHPDGVGTLIFEVEDIQRAFRLLEERGGTPVTDVERFEDDGGALHTFNITTPFGDTTFRFVQREGFRGVYPGLAPPPAPRGGQNRLGFGQIDHVTSNFETMKPALLWMEHVLGFEEFWEVAFHTADAAGEARKKAMQAHGSGLRSIVMRDPKSGVKFANNEPWRPAFKSSQINIFHEEQRGDGVQHAALTVKDILGAVREMRARGVEFMPTPGSYYDLLPDRLARIGVGRVEEDVAVLRDLQILVDGGAPGSYLLQIFLKDAAGLYGEPEAGPFFFEIIQRKGDLGFGAGNFRALFESIEREQQRAGRT